MLFILECCPPEQPLSYRRHSTAGRYEGAADHPAWRHGPTAPAATLLARPVMAVSQPVYQPATTVAVGDTSKKRSTM